MASKCICAYTLLLNQGLKGSFYPGPPGDIDINLVGGHRLGVSGDKATFITEVKTTWEVFIPNKNF